MRLPLLLFLLASRAVADAAPPPSGAPDEILRVYRARPRDASVLYQMAAAHARAGHTDVALRFLERMERVGAGLDPRARDGFAALEADARYQAIKARIRAKNPPVLEASVAYTLAEGDLVPEGIAWSERTRELYLGSVKRKIVAVAANGSVRELVPPGRDGLGAIVGVRVDDRRGELWAVSEIIGEAPPGVVVGVFRFRLPDGALVRAYPVPAAQRDLLNDLAVAPDGSVYVTSSNTGALLRVDPDSGAVDTFLPPGSLPDPNGVAVSADGQALYVAGWHAIARVELATRKVAFLRKPRDVADGCFDGLYVAGADLVGIQNCAVEGGRVVRLRLARDGRAILGAEILESGNPLFNGVTTGAVAGDRFFFQANAQFRKLGTATPFDPVKILVLPL